MSAQGVQLPVIRESARLRERALKLRSQGKRIGLVPTMGALHEGHLSLLRLARPLCDTLILSIFVNPRQFGPTEDLRTYPRNEARDLKLAAQCDVDLAFCPSSESMYPEHYQTSVSLPLLSAVLCGSQRHGHFDGVATIVTKLMIAALPHVAVFGQKDFQQLAILRQLSADLGLGVEILGGPIVREADGLALSSRNIGLSREEREQSTSLYRGLCAAKQRFGEGVLGATPLLGAARAIIASAPLARIEYLELCCCATLSPVSEVRRPSLLATAVRFGRTRLIDNIVLTPD